MLELLAVPMVFAFFQFHAGVFLISQPIPHRTLRAYGPQLIWDSIIIQFLTSTVGLVQIVVDYLQGLVETAIPTSSNTPAFALISAQLIAIDTAIFGIITILSSTVVLSPLAEAVARALTIPLHAVTGSIILWSLIAVVSSYIQQLWVHIWIIGVVLYSLIASLGRQAGATIMASAVILTLGLPLAGHLALQLEEFLVYETAMKGLNSLLADIASDPQLILQLIPTLLQSVANLVVTLIISLILFPIFYLWLLGTMIRSLANLLGGRASANFTNSIISLSNELSGVV